jgi:HEAT repeat protein
MRRLLATGIGVLFVFTCVSESVRLRQQLNSADPAIRADACERLGQLRDKKAAPLLIKLLQDTVPAVRFSAALALGNIGSAEAVAPLTRAIENEPREDVAMAMTRALADLGPPAIEPLIKLTGSIKPLVRMTACRGLGRIGAHQAVEPLVRRIDDPDPNVRRAAIFALRRIGDERGLEAIARRVQSPDWRTEENAEQALSGRGYEEQLERIRQILRRFHH